MKLHPLLYSLLYQYIRTMEIGSIVKFLENKCILVTGATGFLAKIFVEKILRVQPNVKKLYLLVRAPDSDSALHRLNTEVIEKDLFGVIKQKYGESLHAFISEKITSVAGDISSENFGVKDFHLLNEIWKEVDVIVNSAATTKFDERYDVALGINTFGPKHVCDFVKKCLNIKLLLHVSTAYVARNQPGIILETPCKFGERLNGKRGLDIEGEKRETEDRLKQLLTDEKATEASISSAMKDFGLRRANLHGWPNTYVFTKAMGEMLLTKELRHDLALVILRPTIITSTYKEPFPGWIEGIRTIDAFSAAYGKGRTKCFLADPTTILDTIPGDMVVNAMIVAMAAYASQPYSKTIYHVGSSASNPMKISSLRDYNFDYFTKHPILDKNGEPIIVRKKFKVLSSMSSFYIYTVFRYLIPLKGLSFANMVTCQDLSGKCIDANRKINISLRLAKLFEQYTLSRSIYDDTNLNKLLSMTRESNEVETEMFFFDPKVINWEEYFMKTHLPGLVKYGIK